MNRLDGKVALLSGAARGIGAETARLMVEAGAKVAIGDVLDERGRADGARDRAAGGEALYVPSRRDPGGGLGRRDRPPTKQFGGLDILVNNAGIFIGKGIEDATLDEWHRLVRGQPDRRLAGHQAALPASARARPRPARTAAPSSTSPRSPGLVGSQLDPLYSMTKGGVTLFTKSTALEFGRKGYRIRVNSIHPGVIETDMGEQTFVARASAARHQRCRCRARRPRVERIRSAGSATPTDIAKGIVFLASDDAGFMTGAGLVVDGGFTAQ